MVYPAPFHRIVIGGSLYTEQFNTSFAVIPREGSGSIGLPPPADVLPGVAAAIALWWNSGTSTHGDLRMNTDAKIVSVKLNSIGTDGHYTEDVTYEHVYPVPIAGSHGITPPAQIACVVTLRTDAERGLASKGRMYLPAPLGFDQVTVSTGLATAGTALRVAGSMKYLFDAVNAAYAAQESGDEATGRVGVTSNRLAGQFREVHHVSVGRVPDTVRSRRTSLSEDPQHGSALAGVV